MSTRRHAAGAPPAPGYLTSWLRRATSTGSRPTHGFGGGGGGDSGCNGGGGAGGFGGGAGGPGADGFDGGGGGGAGLGGAIFLRAGSLDVGGSTFTNDTATGGTGANNGQGKGGALFILSGATVTGIGSATFSGNSASDATGCATDTNDAYSAGCATTSAVTSAPNPSVYGQSVTFTATVSAATAGAGTPSGQVTFYADGTPLGSGTLDSSGQTTAITSGLSVATHAITATYGGDTR